VVGTYVRHHAYGTTRAGNTADLNTDRTFTGQKQDGTGLLYYNARYYDPSLNHPKTKTPSRGPAPRLGSLLVPPQLRILILGRRLHEGGEFGCVHAGDVRDGGQVKAAGIHRQGNL
jgi:hypothetical protein